MQPAAIGQAKDAVFAAVVARRPFGGRLLRIEDAVANRHGHEIGEFGLPGDDGRAGAAPKFVKVAVGQYQAALVIEQDNGIGNTLKQIGKALVGDFFFQPGARKVQRGLVEATLRLLQLQRFGGDLFRQHRGLLKRAVGGAEVPPAQFDALDEHGIDAL